MRANVVATFFVVGRQAEGRQDDLREIELRGHQIGNHSWSHGMPGRGGWDKQTLASEIQRSERVITAATGVRPCFFRPPGGAMTGVPEVADLLAVRVALWSVDPRDWNQRPGEESAAQRIRQAAEAGLQQNHPVVLLHDGGDYQGATLAALPGIISDYRSHGYEFVRLDGEGPAISAYDVE